MLFQAIAAMVFSNTAPAPSSARPISSKTALTLPIRFAVEASITIRPQRSACHCALRTGSRTASTPQRHTAQALPIIQHPPPSALPSAARGGQAACATAMPTARPHTIAGLACTSATGNAARARLPACAIAGTRLTFIIRPITAAPGEPRLRHAPSQASLARALYPRIARAALYAPTRNAAFPRARQPQARAIAVPGRRLFLVMYISASRRPIAAFPCFYLFFLPAPLAAPLPCLAFSIISKIILFA